MLARSDGGGPVGEARGPALVAPDTQRDVGTVEPGTIVREEFVVWNRGRSRLVLNRPHCRGCGGELPPTYVVPAGAGRRIPVSFRSFGVGPTRRTVEWTTSDPKQPRLTLTVIANVGEARQPETALEYQPLNEGAAFRTATPARWTAGTGAALRPLDRPPKVDPFRSVDGRDNRQWLIDAFRH
ncbi:hypothetical protein [Alienimonas sp. DA493]|uniref:hypothetical protein n=1 Tax=Alienimonas sp. DA493 TaxID=3373605 RepID=UPI00375417E9